VIDKNYEVIILGAGIAGMSLARELSGQGFKILLLDRKKNAGDISYNSSGSFMNPRRWRLPKNILNPINKCYFASKNFHTIKSGRAAAYIIDRKKLLFFLESRAKKNTRLSIEYNARVKGAEILDGKIQSISYSKNGVAVKASGLIYADCSGPGMVLGARAGLIKPAPVNAFGLEYLVRLKKGADEVDFFMGEDLPGGYGWIFPIDKKRAIIGCCTLIKSEAANLEKYLKNLLETPRARSRCAKNAPKKSFAVLKTGDPLKKFTGRNFIILGDAALQANPLLGEGIRFVMDSARMAAKWIRLSVKKQNLSFLKYYGFEWKEKYYQKYKMAFFMQNHLKKITKNDSKMDNIIKSLQDINDKDLYRLLSADISFPFFIRLLQGLF
jgi:flavin-dependent dehydrogenase